MPKRKVVDDLPEQNAGPAAQEQLASSAMGPRTYNNQPAIDTSSDFGTAGRVVTKNQASPDRFHQPTAGNRHELGGITGHVATGSQAGSAQYHRGTAGIQRELGIGHRVNRANQCTNGRYRYFSRLSPIAEGIEFPYPSHARNGDGQGQLSQGMNGIQHEAGTPGNVGVQHATGIQHGPSNLIPSFGHGAGIPANFAVQQPTSTYHGTQNSISGFGPGVGAPGNMSVQYPMNIQHGPQNFVPGFGYGTGAPANLGVPRPMNIQYGPQNSTPGFGPGVGAPGNVSVQYPMNIQYGPQNSIPGFGYGAGVPGNVSVQYPMGIHHGMPNFIPSFGHRAGAPANLGVPRPTSIFRGTQNYASTERGTIRARIAVTRTQDDASISGFQKDPTSTADPENTSVWIEELPADCTLKDLFGALAGCGKIFSASISGLGSYTGVEIAVVTFWDLGGVEKLRGKVQKRDFTVKGHKPTVETNRLITARSQAKSDKSRVLVISGPGSIVSREHLDSSVFRSRYSLEDVLENGKGAWSSLEYRFSSVEQAVQSMEAIRRSKQGTHGSSERKRLWESVTVRFGEDPCEKLVG